MRLDEIRDLEPPYQVRLIGSGKKPITVTGYSENDPLGAGGGLLPTTPTVCFKEGGWLLLADLLANFELVDPRSATEKEDEDG